MQPRSRRGWLCLGVALVALNSLALSAALPGAAVASPRVREQARASASSARSEAERVERYWTPARMRATPPLEGGGEAPRPGADPLASTSAVLATASYAGVPDATIPPFTVNGRLFIRRGGEDGYCSGTAINSPTRELVLTAGHCVNSGPLGPGRAAVWSEFLQFVPAYNGGLAPFGAFVARRGSVFAPKPWINRGNSNYDIGAFLTLPNANGQNVADAVGGGATIVTNQNRHQEFQTFGYPGASSRMRTCSSPYVGDDSFTYALGGPPTMAIRCHWIPGASGGGWLIDNGTEIDGLTSYGLRKDPIHTYGPYFGSGNVGALVKGL